MTQRRAWQGQDHSRAEAVIIALGGAEADDGVDHCGCLHGHEAIDGDDHHLAPHRQRSAKAPLPGPGLRAQGLLGNGLGGSPPVPLQAGAGAEDSEGQRAVPSMGAQSRDPWPLPFTPPPPQPTGSGAPGAAVPLILEQEIPGFKSQLGLRCPWTCRALVQPTHMMPSAMETRLDPQLHSQAHAWRWGRSQEPQSPRHLRSSRKAL